MINARKCIGAVTFIALAFAATARSQEHTRITVHVRASTTELREELTPGRLRPNVASQHLYTLFTVDSDRMTYTLESSGNRQPEVGKDYEVKKVTPEEMVLLIPGKKRPAEVHFQIKSKTKKT
jgi:hypothetical protein